MSAQEPARAVAMVKAGAQLTKGLFPFSTFALFAYKL